MANLVRKAVDSCEAVGVGLRAGTDNSVDGSIDEVKRTAVVGGPTVGDMPATQ